MLPVRSRLRVSTRTAVGMKIVMPLAVIVRAVVLYDWIFPSSWSTSSSGSVCGAMFTGEQGACAIALTEVNTNRQVNMRAGLRRVMKLYFLEVIICCLLFPSCICLFLRPGSRRALGRGAECNVHA